MIYNDEYVVKDKFPRKEDYIIFHVYNKGSVLFSGNFAQLKSNFLIDSELGVYSVKKHITNTGYIIEEEFIESEFKLARGLHFKKEQNLINNYKKELFRLEGTTNLVINEMLYDKAYQERHLEGYQAIEDEFIDLVSFANDIISAYHK